MLRNLIIGAVLAAGAAIVLLIGSGSELEHLALLGAALGGVLGLVPSSWLPGKFLGFLVGFVLAWIGFALRAAVLPDSTSGRVVAAVVVLMLCALVAALTQGRLPLWSALLGVASILAAYENVYSAAPAQFLSSSPTAATTALLTAAVGALTTTFVTRLLPDRDPAPGEKSQPGDYRPAVDGEGRHRGTATNETEPAEHTDELQTLMGDKR